MIGQYVIMTRKVLYCIIAAGTLILVILLALGVAGCCKCCCSNTIAKKEVVPFGKSLKPRPKLDFNATHDASIVSRFSEDGKSHRSYVNDEIKTGTSVMLS